MSNRADVQNFIKIVVDKLENQNTHQMITLKMQLYFMCNFQHKQKMVKTNRTELMIRLKPLETEILEFKKVHAEDLSSTLYKKIVYYVVLASGLGNPSLDPVYKEGQAALKSILDEKELLEFLNQPKYVKEEQLQEFVKLVTGIRLFNKDCGKGGEGMDDCNFFICISIIINGSFQYLNC